MKSLTIYSGFTKPYEFLSFVMKEEDILKNVGKQTANRPTIEVNGYHQLLGSQHPSKHLILLSTEEEIHTGLKQPEHE